VAEAPDETSRRRATGGHFLPRPALTPGPESQQYTIEGQIQMLGDFASAASRAKGLRGVVARALAIFLLLGALSTVAVVVLGLILVW